MGHEQKSAETFDSYLIFAGSPNFENFIINMSLYCSRVNFSCRSAFFGIEYGVFVPQCYEKDKVSIQIIA